MSPVTIPALPTDTLLLLLLQAPPGAVADIVIAVLTHILDGPEMALVAGKGSIETILVATAAPQLLVTR